MTSPALFQSFSPDRPLAFIGGGNMASAILGGLIQRGLSQAAVRVIEPFEAARSRLKQAYGVDAQSAPDAGLAGSALVVWAVKPQTFQDAAAQAAPYLGRPGPALHLSVAAGIRSDSIAAWLGSQRVVRSMPNTPALIGRGITGLFALAAVEAQHKETIEAIVGTTGQWVWLEHEDLLDAVTALSGSGPAYVFYFLEAMVEAGTQMGLSPAQARQLALATFSGASALAADSSEPLALLRERVTSKGGTTHAALTALQAADVKAHFMAAMESARKRAQELGQEFGRQ